MSERQVYLPLEKLDKCHVCGKRKSLHLCAACTERIYCSSQCQRKDWNTHKHACGRTERVDLGAFFPFLAALFERSRLHRGVELHPALKHVILNNPGPGSEPETLPDDYSARFVRLGRPLNACDYGPNALPDYLHPWWPLGCSSRVRTKLRRRILREGYVLPIALSLCLTLLSTFYATTSEGNSDQKRIRLRYRSSPIADFGIAAGKAKVTPEDKLAYVLPDETIMKGQDPDDHYWIYFTTLRGEELLLDCGMFPFNVFICVSVANYLPPPLSETIEPYVPGFFRDRLYAAIKQLDLHGEERRVSVLRNPLLHEAVMGYRLGDTDSREVEIMQSFMRDVSRGTATERELKLLPDWVTQHIQSVQTLMQNETWKTFPREPTIGVETDPGFRSRND